MVVAISCGELVEKGIASTESYLDNFSCSPVFEPHGSVT